MEDTGKDRPDAVDESTAVKEVFESFRDRSTTTPVTLAKLGSEVCAKCGWQLITERSDSKGQFGTDLRSPNQLSTIDAAEKRRMRTKNTKRRTTAQGI